MGDFVGSISPSWLLSSVGRIGRRRRAFRRASAGHRGCCRPGRTSRRACHRSAARPEGLAHWADEDAPAAAARISARSALRWAAWAAASARISRSDEASSERSDLQLCGCQVNCTPCRQGPGGSGFPMRASRPSLLGLRCVAPRLVPASVSSCANVSRLRARGRAAEAADGRLPELRERDRPVEVGVGCRDRLRNVEQAVTRRSLERPPSRGSHPVRFVLAPVDAVPAVERASHPRSRLPSAARQASAWSSTSTWISGATSYSYWTARQDRSRRRGRCRASRRNARRRRPFHRR